MLHMIQEAPPDPILGLTEAFNKDARAHKINLSIGVFQDTLGHTPLLQCVRDAEARLIKRMAGRAYLPIAGLPGYGEAVRTLLFGPETVADQGCILCVQTPGGTGALRIAAELIRTQFPAARLWMSDPTWPNHPKIFAAAGVACLTYPYHPDEHGRLQLEPLLSALSASRPGDAVLLHACAHNPSGMDPLPEQWRALAAVLRERQLLPVIDMAYQGFARGLEEDRGGLDILAAACPELLVASSFSKNFSLYSERIGALVLRAGDAGTAGKAFSRVKAIVRTIYSNPPAHGALIVTTILEDAALRATWLQELEGMRRQLVSMRSLLAEGLNKRGLTLLAEVLGRQQGMFSYAGFTDEQVRRLREDHAVYMVKGGRLNVAGLSPERIDAVCDAIVATQPA